MDPDAPTQTLRKASQNLSNYPAMTDKELNFLSAILRLLNPWSAEYLM